MKFAIATISMLICANASAFEGFDTEAQKVTSNIGCASPKVTGPTSSFGKLYTCIGGNEETVKFFINEIPQTNKVKNVKFLWNDYSKNVGYGVHADAAIAKAWAAVMATIYAPLQAEEIITTFNKNDDTTIENEKYRITYTYSRGPAIDERMFVITEK